MKKTFLFIILLLCSNISMLAQQQHENRHFNPEEFRAKLEDFIGRKAGFSSAEAQAFFPIFHQMKEEQRNLQKEIFKLKRNNPEENLPEKEYSDRIQRICDLNTKMTEIQGTYYKKLYKVVPAQKVYKAMLAEDYFHRMMLRQLDQRRKNPHHKKQ